MNGNFCCICLFPATTFAPVMRSTITPAKKDEFLGKVTELIIKHGINDLTMDMIAGELKMSKKTIYVMVRKKTQLIHEVIERYVQKEKEFLELMSKDAENAMHETILLFNHIIKQTDGFKSSTLVELQKFFPKSYIVFHNYRATFLYHLILRNVHAGVAQGYYREGFNVEVISKIYIGMLKVLIDQELFPSAEFSFNKILKEYIHYHLRAIITEKGLAALQQHEDLI